LTVCGGARRISRRLRLRSWERARTADPRGFPRAQAVEQFRSFARLAAEAADRHGVAVALEAINRTETNFLHTLAEAVEHAQAIGLPSVGVLADAYHMHMEAEPFRHLLETAGLLRHVQVCDEGPVVPRSHGSTSGASSSISTISVQRNRICGVR